MRRRTDDRAGAEIPHLDRTTGDRGEFPAFVVDDWMDHIKSGSPKEPKYAYYAYMRARQQWCRDRGINIHEYAHRGRR